MSCATWTSSACPKLGPSLTGYLAIAIRKFEIGIDTNPAGTKKGETTLSLSLDRARRRGEERKEKKRKKKETEKRDVANFRSPRGKSSRWGTFARRRAPRGGFPAKNVREKAHNYIWGG